MHPGMEKFQKWAFFERRALLDRIIEGRADRFDAVWRFMRKEYTMSLPMPCMTCFTVKERDGAHHTF